MRFSELATYFERLEQTPSRLEMTRILAELFKAASAEEIPLICYLSLGRLTPLYESLEFNLAEKMVVRALAQAFDTGKDTVTTAFKKTGDLGEVAEALKRSHKSPIRPVRQAQGGQAQGEQATSNKLTVNEVYQRLRAVAEAQGAGSQEKKVSGVAQLLQELDGLSCRYVARMVVGKLRLGFSDKTIIDGLSWMKTGNKSLRDQIEEAYFYQADIGRIAQAFKKHGTKALKNFTASLGIPVMPALCQRLKTADEMIVKMGEVAVEPKFDGTRVQIHFARSYKLQATSYKPFLKTFTRNLEETTHMFPELKGVGKEIHADSVILDSEAVGLDPKTKKLLTFQQTIVRKRKHEVEATSRLVPLKFFVFDILYKDGKSLLELPLGERRKLLQQVVPDTQGILRLTEHVLVRDAVALRTYHAQQLKAGLEGAVVKKIHAPYTPGRRGWSWVKFKEVETATGGLRDTLDCVVMGYYAGRGKRAGFGIGAFLVGVKQGEKFVTVAKIGTGLSDEQWREMKVRADKARMVEAPKEYIVAKSLIPDVWVSPKIVVEIAADNITHSPNHSAKLALRFPRLVRFRDDKAPAQVTTVREVEQLL